MHPIRVGTCGWSYKEWVGVFYPPGTPAGEFLTHYAQKFHVVEVDSTFYRPPSVAMAQGWRDKTPPGFGFSLKVPQVITHEKKLLDCKEDLTAFLTGARALEDKLLCCLLQFGYFNRTAFVSLPKFLERLEPFLDCWPRDIPLAIEVRNKNWLTEALADCLRRHNVIWALADQMWVPSPTALMQKMDVVTGPFAYVRLLGDREAVDRLTKTLDHTVVDRSDQLRADAQAIRRLADRVPVVTFVNNHFAGYAPDTIRDLEAELAKAPE